MVHCPWPMSLSDTPRMHTCVDDDGLCHWEFVAGFIACMVCEYAHVSLLVCGARTSVWHVVSGVGWAMNATAAQKQEAFTDTTELNSFLRDAFPTSGAYWLEADYNEPSWETSFWGASNYQRLLTLKQQYDPTGVFTCHHCVGDSE